MSLMSNCGEAAPCCLLSGKPCHNTWWMVIYSWICNLHAALWPLASLASVTVQLKVPCLSCLYRKLQPLNNCQLKSPQSNHSLPKDSPSHLSPAKSLSVVIIHLEWIIFFYFLLLMWLKKDLFLFCRYWQTAIFLWSYHSKWRDNVGKLLTVSVRGSIPLSCVSCEVKTSSTCNMTHCFLTGLSLYWVNLLTQLALKSLHVHNTGSQEQI